MNPPVPPLMVSRCRCVCCPSWPGPAPLHRPPFLSQEACVHRADFLCGVAAFSVTLLPQVCLSGCACPSAGWVLFILGAKLLALRSHLWLRLQNLPAHLLVSCQKLLVWHLVHQLALPFTSFFLLKLFF